MNDKFESTNIDEIDDAVEHFYRFHDDYVAGIEIKFENYKALDDDGASEGIKNAEKTVILTINTYPYEKEHEQYVRVEFKDVKSFEIFSSAEDNGPKTGPTWGIMNTLLIPDGVDTVWEFEFICGDTKFFVICSKIAIHKQTT